MAYLSDDLLTAIKRDSYLPTVQGNFTDAQMLAIADEQLLDTLAPLLVSMDGSYFRESTDIRLITSQAAYNFPRYAMWDKFFRIALVDQSTGEYFDLSRTDPSTLENLNLATTGTPRFCYLQDKQIVLVPAPDATSVTTYNLRCWIYRRPGRLVATTSAAVVSSIAAATGVLTYTAAKPSTFTSTSTHDAYAHTSPFKRVTTGMTATASGSTTTHTFPGPRTLGYDGVTAELTAGLLVTGGTSAATGTLVYRTSTTLTLSGVTGAFQDNETLTDTAGGSVTANGTLTNSLTDTDTIGPGDYVCVADETVYPALPVELHAHLKDLVIAQIARTQVDRQQHDLVMAKIIERARIALAAAPGAQIVSQPKKFTMWTHGFLYGRSGRKTTT